MKATQVLIEEHEVIVRVLNALDRASNSPITGPDFFIGAAEFIRGFADGCHHRKEENVLFTAMEHSGVPVQGGPIGVMLLEHEQGRRLTRAMRAGAEQWAAGSAAARVETYQAAAEYVALLRQHIAKENGILFPMADRAIPADRQEQVWEDFERVEHEETGEGVHEKYLALAETLERQAATL